MERLEKIMYWFGYAAGYFLAVAWMFIAIGFWQLATAEEIEPEFHLQSTTVIVHWFDTEEELQEALGWSDTAGYSECESRPDFNMAFCELWLVKPKNTTELSDDEWFKVCAQKNKEYDCYAFDTIGHEFYHALAGDFHDVPSD